MSFKEVTKLRKEGKLEEAYELAKSGLEGENKEDIWAKRAMAWVLIVFLKKNASYDQRADFLKYLTEFADLNLPSSDEMVYENLKYWIIKFSFSITKTDFLDSSLLDNYTTIYKKIPVTKPSEMHSKVLMALLKKADWHGLFSFIQWWDLNNLRTEDLQEEEYNDRKSMSLAERSYIAYSKLAIASQQVTDGLIKQVESFVEEHPKFIYPQYYLGKLLLESGDREEAFKRFIPFAKKKKNDFWVWDLLSEIQQDLDLKIACLCKALTCKSPPKMLVKVHYKLAQLLIDKKEFTAAKFEVDRTIQIRNNEGWRIPNDLQNMVNQKWYVDAQKDKNNWRFYKTHLKEAEDLLYFDIIPEIAVITHVNREKSVLNYIISKDKNGFFNYSKYFRNARQGEFLKLRSQLQKKGNNTFYKVLTAEKTNETPNSDVYKSFGGKLKLIEGKGFGFIDDIFVPPYFVRENNLERKGGIEFNGTAILNFNKKRNAWDWKIISIRSK